MISSGIAQQGAWADLPILADALQDAGCDDADILDHLRGVSEHHAVPFVEGKLLEWDQVTHSEGVFPNLNGGCWQGTCWVVQMLLQRPQRIVAHYNVEGTFVGDLWESPVINPGAADGRAWLIEPSTWANGPTYVVESKYVTGAEDELVDDDDFGKHYRISEEDLKDYLVQPGEWGENPEPPEYSCEWTGSGNPYNSEDIFIHGDETAPVPWACRYHGPGLPPKGLDPRAYANFGPCEHCKRERFPCVRWLPHRICSKACYEALREEWMTYRDQTGGMT